MPAVRELGREHLAVNDELKLFRTSCLGALVALPLACLLASLVAWALADRPHTVHAAPPALPTLTPRMFLPVFITPPCPAPDSRKGLAGYDWNTTQAEARVYDCLGLSAIYQTRRVGPQQSVYTFSVPLVPSIRSTVDHPIDVWGPLCGEDEPSMVVCAISATMGVSLALAFNEPGWCEQGDCITTEQVADNWKIISDTLRAHNPSLAFIWGNDAFATSGLYDSARAAYEAKYHAPMLLPQDVIGLHIYLSQYVITSTCHVPFRLPQDYSCLDAGLSGAIQVLQGTIAATGREVEITEAGLDPLALTANDDAAQFVCRLFTRLRDTPHVRRVWLYNGSVGPLANASVIDANGLGAVGRAYQEC